MLQAAILFGLYSILFVIVSLLTPAPEPAHISDVCWNSPRDVFADGQERSLQSPQVLGALIFFAVILLYAFMR